tara:strand:+ start:695 stop:1465 length:771 start_codon:yes stop_codon:yes gene_type:complete
MVTVVSHAGIANRIKNLLSAISQHGDVSTLHDTISFIFPSIKKVDEVEEEYPEDWRLYVDSEEEKHIPDYKTIDLLYEKTPKYFIKKYLDIIHKLKINSEMIEYVSEFTDTWDDMVGVHIRSWYCPKKVFHSNEIFENQIDKLPEDKKFFFCSDNSDVQQHFVDRYGDRVVIYQRQMFNDPKLAESGHHDDIQLTTDAFIELLILSKCATIIGTYASSFDELAWWMSGCTSKVIIPTPINCDKELEDFNNLIYVKK